MPAISSSASTEAVLSQLRPGQEATVVSLDDSGPVGRRLLDLGLLPGTLIRALRRAPLGDPGVYELRGYRLCLRSSETDRVRISALGSALGSGPGARAEDAA